MIAQFQKIVGLTIAAVTFRKGYLEITMSDGYLLLVSNRTTIELQPEDILGDAPVTISSVTRSPDDIRIVIGQSSAIRIGCRPADFRSPEALVLSGPEGTWVDRGD